MLQPALMFFRIRTMAGETIKSYSLEKFCKIIWAELCMRITLHKAAQAVSSWSDE